MPEKIIAKPLTRGAVKTLRKEGIELTRLSAYDAAKIDEIVDRVVELALGEAVAAAADDLTNDDYYTLFGEIMDITYPSATEKNSSPPGAGAPPADRADAPSAGAESV